MKLTELPGAKFVLPVLVVLLVAGGIAFVTLGSWLRHGETPPAAGDDTGTPVELVRDASGRPLSPPTMRLSARAAKALGVGAATIVPADTPRALRALPPQMGTLAYDNDRLFAVRSRFPGEVSEIENCPPDQRGGIPRQRSFPLPPSADVLAPRDEKRPFTVGDVVKKGQVLAVVWSKDLGDKKAALIDAIIDLRRDMAQLKDLEKLYAEGSVSAATYLEAQRTVKKDISARNAAERILRMWKLSDGEIAALKREAETLTEETRDPNVEKYWAREEIRAPGDGVIVEKNTHRGDWADPSNYGTPLFRVADLDKLQVWINPAEEYLPVLQAFLKRPLATPLAWDIFLQAEPKAPPLSGALLRIAPSLDYTQHTPLLVGEVDNPRRQLLIGQFVTATIYVPLEKGLVEIPTTALYEEKGQSVVLVQRDPEKHPLDFTLQAVSVVHRFKDVVYVRSRLPASVRAPLVVQMLGEPYGVGAVGPTPPLVPFLVAAQLAADEALTLPPAQQGDLAPDALPLRVLLPGERVVAESVVELTKALRDLRAKEELARRSQQQK
jgi:cobalt-zinc-cadmium efflux system membrane fusion protein